MTQSKTAPRHDVLLGRPCFSCQTSSRTSSKKSPKLVIGHSAFFDLAAERGKGLVHRRRFLNVPLDEQVNVIG